jgi:hypothetical protein
MVVSLVNDGNSILSAKLQAMTFVEWRNFSTHHAAVFFSEAVFQGEADECVYRSQEKRQGN